jgi:hypothetical protein
VCESLRQVAGTGFLLFLAVEHMAIEHFRSDFGTPPGSASGGLAGSRCSDTK